MAYASWAPLWNQIVDSSVWQEPLHVRVVWITMLALKDMDHIVRYNAFRLASRAHLKETEVLEALKILSEPDRRRVEPQPFGGRRIEKVEDGWLILNGAVYQDMVRQEMKKARNRKSQAEFRKKHGTAKTKMPTSQPEQTAIRESRFPNDPPPEKDENHITTEETQ